MKKYKVWLEIEECDEEKDHYENVPDQCRSVSPEFDTLAEAITFRDNMLDEVTECECDNTHEQNKTVCRFCWNAGIRYKEQEAIDGSNKTQITP